MKELTIHHIPAEGDRPARVRVGYRAREGAQAQEREADFRNKCRSHRLFSITKIQYFRLVVVISTTHIRPLRFLYFVITDINVVESACHE